MCVIRQTTNVLPPLKFQKFSGSLYWHFWKPGLLCKVYQEFEWYSVVHVPFNFSAYNTQQFGTASCLFHNDSLFVSQFICNFNPGIYTRNFSLPYAIIFHMVQSIQTQVAEQCSSRGYGQWTVCKGCLGPLQGTLRLMEW